MKPVQYYAKFRDAAREDDPVVITRQISIVFEEMRIVHETIYFYKVYKVLYILYFLNCYKCLAFLQKLSLFDEL